MTYRHFESILKVDSSIHDIYKATVSSRILHLGRNQLITNRLLQNDLLKRISQQQPGVLETFTKVCRRASLWVVNRSSIHTLLQRTGKSDFIGAKAVKLLRYVSKHRPAILKTHIAELQKTLSDKLSTASVEAGIQCLAQASFGNASLKLDR